MSKRGAEFYLTDRNYDTYNEKDDDNEGNTFKRASEDVLSKRKIKPLRRRVRAPLKKTSDKPSTLSAFSFKPSTTGSTNPFPSTTKTSVNSSSTDNAMKEKVKKFTEQICGLNKSFVAFLTNSIKEDIVFDISLNIPQYQEKRKAIEKEFDDVIQYLTNNKSALKPETTSKSNFSFSTPSNSSTANTKTTTTTSTFSFNKPSEDKKEAKPFKFSFGNNTTSSTTTTTSTKPAFTFNLNKDKPATTTTTAPTFSFTKPDNKSTTTTTTSTKPAFTFNLNKDKPATTTAPTFSFTKPDNKSTTTTTTSTTSTTAPTFSFKKPENDNKDGKEASTKPTIPTFKPFTFSFGQKMADSSSGDQNKTLPKPNFSFGVAAPSKSEVAAAAAASNEDNEEEQSEQAQLTTGAGEEDEDTVYEVKAKIHHYDMEEKKYVSRGVGLLKVNKNKKTNKSRLLGRMDNGTVFINVSLFKEMVVSDPGNATQFTFNAMDRVGDSDEIKMVRFAVRVKDKESAKKLYNAIIENKK